MKKRFFKFVVLLICFATFLFWGCGGTGTDYGYSEKFGATSKTTFAGARGDTDALEEKFIKGSMSLNSHKDSNGYVKNFSYTIKVTGFSDDLAYTDCVVEVTVKYSVIENNGSTTTQYSSAEVVLNARGAGEKSKTETIACKDIKVIDVSYSYEGIVTYL